MRITQEIKLKMVEDHSLRGKSVAHISQEYDNYDVGNIKSYVNLYKKFDIKYRKPDNTRKTFGKNIFLEYNWDIRGDGSGYTEERIFRTNHCI